MRLDILIKLFLEVKKINVISRFFIICLMLFCNCTYAQATQLNSSDSLTFEEVEQQAQNIDMSGWLVFGDNVKSCAVSTFDLPNPTQIKAFITVASSMQDVSQNVNHLPVSLTQADFDRMLTESSIHIEILGWLKNNCQVTMSMSTGPLDQIPHSNRTIVRICLIPRDSIPFVLTTLKRISSGGTDINYLSPDPLSSMIASFCK